MSSELYFFHRFKKGRKTGIIDIFGKEYFSDDFQSIRLSHFELIDDDLLQNHDEINLEYENQGTYIIKENHIHTSEDLPKHKIVFYAKKGDKKGFINLKGEFLS
jgi:hypothetical protein